MTRNPLVDDSNQRILELLADGLTVGQVAVELHLSAHTVATRLMRLRAAYDVKTTTGLVAVALRRHLIS